jgi:hypothetical protein
VTRRLLATRLPSACCALSRRSAYVAGPTPKLLSQFDVDDIDTKVRTLQAITERAAG